MIDAVFINGTVGAGKTTTAEALAESQAAKRMPHALIDLDQLRRAWPSPPDDPFNARVALTNLTSVVRNYRTAGAARFIVAGVIEDPDEVPEFRRALGTDELLICRLRGDLDVLAGRLRFRHAGDETALSWHLERVGQLDRILQSAALDDVVLDSTVATPSAIARSIEDAAGW